ncbi:peptidogalycan biosysnthesis protein [Streptomyces sp. WAC 01529]|uniref:peptidogalycan biosysnthesis protein n=1 Tax=Streptomyces sp. WAC 01529 TaxID=2203205 RepID=UPI0013DECDBA|nr:peptidogalycan biosysnthesis protein [Streptomyces sp. WAC 01529]
MTATTRHAIRIADLGDDWTRLADSLYALPAWLATAERPEVDRHYLVFDGHSEGAEPTGGLVAYPTGPDGWVFNNPLALLSQPQPSLVPHLTADERQVLEGARPQLSEALAELYPTLVSVLPGGYLPGLLRDRTAGPEVIDELLCALEDLADRQGAPSVAVMHVPEAEAAGDLGQALLARGYLPFAAVGDCALRTPWQSLDGYLADLHTDRRRKYRSEMRAFARAGMELREIPLAEFGEAHASLHTLHMKRYGHETDDAASMRLIESIKKHFPDSARVLQAERDGQLCGFVLFYAVSGAYHPKMIGIAEGEKKTFTYFNLCYYGLIQLAVEESVREIFYGPEAYAAKALRGCALDVRVSYLRVPDSVRDLAAPVATVLDAARRRELASYPWAAGPASVTAQP